MVKNTPFIGRVEKGVESSGYITKFAVIRILAGKVSLKFQRMESADVQKVQQDSLPPTTFHV